MPRNDHGLRYQVCRRLELIGEIGWFSCTMRMSVSCKVRNLIRLKVSIVLRAVCSMDEEVDLLKGLHQLVR